jgi:hypothetical protein
MPKPVLDFVWRGGEVMRRQLRDERWHKDSYRAEHSILLPSTILADNLAIGRSSIETKVAAQPSLSRGKRYGAPKSDEGQKKAYREGVSVGEKRR